jgi:hypothetical protein
MEKQMLGEGKHLSSPSRIGCGTFRDHRAAKCANQRIYMTRPRDHTIRRIAVVIPIFFKVIRFLWEKLLHFSESRRNGYELRELHEHYERLPNRL